MIVYAGLMSPPSENGPTRITAQAAAELLGISVNTLYEWAQDKRIPAKKVGSRWIFVRENLEAWLVATDDSQAPPSDAESGW